MQPITDWEEIPVKNTNQINDWEEISIGDENTLAKTGAMLADVGLGFAETGARLPQIMVRTAKGAGNSMYSAITGDKEKLIADSPNYGNTLLDAATAGNPINLMEVLSRNAGNSIADYKASLRDGENSQSFKDLDKTSAKSESAFHNTNIPKAADEIAPAFKSLMNGEVGDALSKLSDADYSKAIQLLKDGKWEEVGQILSNPSDVVPIVAGAAPNMALARLGGAPIMSLLEGGDLANDAAQFERETGKQIPNDQYLKSLAQTTIGNTLLEKAGLDSVTGKNATGALSHIGKAAIKEPSTEIMQQFNSNLSKLGYDPSQPLSEGMLSAGIGGLGMGVGASSLSAAAHKLTGAYDKPVDDNGIPPPNNPPIDGGKESPVMSNWKNVIGDDNTYNEDPIAASTPINPKTESIKRALLSTKDKDFTNVDRSILDELENHGHIQRDDTGAPRLTSAGNDLLIKLTPTELSPSADIDTAKVTIDTIRNGDLQNINKDLLNDLVKTEMAVVLPDGGVNLTSMGEQLAAEIDNLQTSEIRNVQQEEIVPQIPVNQDRTGIAENEIAAPTQEVDQSALSQEDQVKQMLTEYMATRPQSSKNTLDLDAESKAFNKFIENKKHTIQPTTEQTTSGEQFVMPGAERITDKEYAERKMAQPDKATVTQKDANEGLFDTSSRNQIDLLDAPKAPIKQRKQRSTNSTLLEFIANIGGIKDDGGDFKAIDADLWHKEKPFRKKLVSDKGMSADDLALSAWESGYFPEFTERPTINDLHTAINNELSGKKRYREGMEPVNTVEDEDALAHYMANYEEYDYSDNSGTKTKSVSDEYLNDIPFSATKKTDSPEFKKWFGDSNVVDDKGEPLTVYHGTSADIKVFKSKHDLSAFFFSDSPEVAGTYADENGANVIPVYLSMQNPKIIDANGAYFYDAGGKNKSADYLGVIAKQEGHDGVIIHNIKDELSVTESGNPSTVYMVFKPTQIKSASGNNGNYDATDPSIVNSVTPSPKFEANKDQLKTKVTNIIRKINPTVNIKLMDKMFGEGSTLKDSGATSTERQEVAGAYSNLKNLIYASMNTDKWNPEDTAYHEAFHSIFEMLSAADKAILTKAFPGNDKFSSEEQMAVNFARFMTEKNATGFTPAVRRIFLAIKEALRQIGRTLKLGKFESFEDVFNRVESGEVYANRDVVREAIATGSIANLDKMLAEGKITPEQLKKAIEDISPDLHDVVYSDQLVSSEDNQAMLDMLSSQGESFAKDALEHRVFNKDIPYDETKLDEATEDYLKYSMTATEAKEYLANEKSLVKKVVDGLTKNDVSQGVKWVGNTLFLSKVADMRRIANSAIDPVTGKKTRSKSAQALTDIFSSDPGSGRGVKAGYDARISDFAHPRLTRIIDAVKGFDKTELGQVVKLMQNPEAEFDVNSKVGKAAVALEKINREILKFARDNGLDINDVKGYFPRRYLEDQILADKKGFVKDATEAFRQTAKDHALENKTAYAETEEMTAEYKEYADKWFQRIKDSHDGISLQDGLFQVEAKQVPTPPSMQNRPLSKSADDIMRPWLNQDPVEVMAAHLLAMTRKAVFNDLFGTDQIKIKQLQNNIKNNGKTPELTKELKEFQTTKFKHFEEDMRDEGISSKDIEEMKQIVEINTGIRWRNVTTTQRNVKGLILLAATLKFLPLAVKNAVVESWVNGVNSGSVYAGMKAFARTPQIFIKMAKPDKVGQSKIDAAIALARKIGLVNDIVEQILIDRRSDLDGVDKYSQIMHLFFEKSLISPVTTATKVASLMAGNELFHDLCNDIVKQNNRYKSAELMTSDFIGDTDVKEFAEWFLKHEKDLMSFNSDIVLEDSTGANQYRLAIRKYVESTIQTPTTAVKPRWATHPYGSLIYSLSSFFYSYEHNVLGASYNKAKQGVTNKGYDGKKLDLTAQDRARLVYPLTLAIGMMSIVVYGFNKLWDEIYPNENKPESTPAGQALQTLTGAGLAGKFTPLIGAMTYGSDVGKLGQGSYGASIAKLFNASTDVIKGKSKGNSDKRVLAREILTTIILPTVNYGVTTILPKPLAFPILQAANMPVTKNKLVDRVAGKAKKKKKNN